MRGCKCSGCRGDNRIDHKFQRGNARHAFRVRDNEGLLWGWFFGLGPRSSHCGYGSFTEEEARRYVVHGLPRKECEGVPSHRWSGVCLKIRGCIDPIVYDSQGGCDVG